MSNTTCHQTADMLVDYVDGELHAADEQMVKQHLADCGDCRAALVRLDRSLQLSREIWDERNSTASSTSINAHRYRWRTSLNRAAATLAACLLVVIFAWPGTIMDTSSQESISKHTTSSQETKTDFEASAAASQLTVDAEKQISRAVMAAQLEASSVLLATDPSLSEYRERNDRLLATQFADFEAGRQALLRLNRKN